MMWALLLQVELVELVVLTQVEMVAQLLNLSRDNAGTARHGSSRRGSATELPPHSSTAAVAVVVVLPQLQHAQVVVAEAVEARCGLLLRQQSITVASQPTVARGLMAVAVLVMPVAAVAEVAVTSALALCHTLEQASFKLLVVAVEQALLQVLLVLLVMQVQLSSWCSHDDTEVDRICS